MDVAAIVPTYNEQENIRATIHALASVPEVDEVIVVDGHSHDDTARLAMEAGARVIEQKHPLHPGKGIALETGIEASDAEVFLCFDADLANVSPAMASRLLRPIIEGRAEHTIGAYDRVGGRVTNLTVKPLLGMFFPEVRFRQPLAGEYAFEGEVLRSLRLEPGWGLESGLVIDTVMGGHRSKEVDLGFKHHPMKSLDELTPMATEAAATIIDRALEHGRIVAEPTLVVA